ncbi:hypothetical protein MNO14_02230 [Luteimonas sp. S4-F44]|uniref:hypothetical protein n=1 Tax=Luteimonas sp. S4-F44 TaxID=2925842 RepID=UPI001F534AEA|nr:hypothetical protein [Luteimonas sp. S4-F44]UNK42943.1 hypothetical protein MNO14_02230 [Luteimonas sp. S4-F44]
MPAVARPFAAALFVASLALAGCQDREAQAAAQAQAQAQADEQQAAAGERDFEAAVAAENWALAKAQADVLLSRYPQTEAAGRVRAKFDEVRSRGDAVREQARTAALWSYDTRPADGGQQVSAAIYAREPVDVDGSGAKPVRLIFRDHPSWGRSSYLVLEAGDFDCYPSCRVEVAVDDAAPRRMAANRPQTDEAIAMFIDDEKALWRLLDGAKTLSIAFPVKAGGTRTAVFEVAGLDRARMPGWQ